MSEEFRETESADTGVPTLPAVGSQLKAAREAKQMSVSDIALALKLGARQVDALENGDWQSLPGQTFIRGFVRNYARLLQVDPAPLMAQLDGVLVSTQQRLTLPGQKRHVAMPQQGRRRRRDYAMAFVGVGLVAVAAAVYFLWPSDMSEVKGHIDSLLAVFSKKEPEPVQAPAGPGQSPAEQVFPPGTTPQQVMNPQSAAVAGENGAAPATSPLVPPPVQQDTTPAAQPAPPVAPALPAQPAAPSAVAAQAASSTTSPQQLAPVQAAPIPTQPEKPVAADKAAGTENTLHFAFEQDSWVEVKDRNGKIIFSRGNKAGTEQSVNGQGPFSLVIGNAPGVKLTLRGRAVDLGARTQGNVARFTLE